eukprot:TRINITY_DN29042_c0_g1_i1.p1 TRINITY_DN29042_c0_g1~~TRINITY_DN29042_c0_g1_i1.p1  ORF type:complete len:296 (-),score=47.47 TRINITY_DN29042_c0_g1_i1:39-926(-)
MVEVQIALLGGEHLTLLASPEERLGTLGCRLLSQTKHHAAAQSHVRFMFEETCFTSSTCVRDLPSRSLTAVVEPIPRGHVMNMADHLEGSVDTSGVLSYEGEDKVVSLCGSDSDAEGERSGQVCRGVSYLDMSVKYANEDDHCLEIYMADGCNSSYTFALLNEAQFGTDLEVRVLAGGEFGIWVGLMTREEFNQVSIATDFTGIKRAVQFAARGLDHSEESGESIERLRLLDSQGTATLFRGQEAQVTFPQNCHWFVAAQGHDGDFGEPLITIKLLASEAVCESVSASNSKCVLS